MYDTSDPRSRLAAAAPTVTAAGAFTPSEIGRYYEDAPQLVADRSKTWMTRGQAMVVAYSEAEPGAVLERNGQVDEYVLLLPDRDKVVQARKSFAGKIARQSVKDYVLFPALSRSRWRRTLAANAAANLLRNFWAYAVIFCGHFPDGAEKFTADVLDNETRGEWYLRQMLGAANFNAGPAGLPTAVLETAQAELLDYRGTGMSIMEHSHRGKAYDAVHADAIRLIQELYGVPDTHAVFFVQGGASGMFATVPMNFLTEGKTADYVVTGAWSEKALEEAQIVGQAREAATGAKDGQYVAIPRSYDLTPGAAYVHITTNNTIFGSQFDFVPEVEAPLVADMSSDIMSRPLDVSKFGLIYAGAQKNLGPSGVVVGIVKKDWLASASTKIPSILRYKTHVDKDSLFHTPPTFAIYLMKNVLEWVRDSGGLSAMEARNTAKAEALYGAIDASGGFYACPVEVDARSQMNVVWRLPDEGLEKAFLSEATEAGLVGLKGHRSVGGIRASLYNAVEPSDVERLVAFMSDFKGKRG